MENKERKFLYFFIFLTLIFILIGLYFALFLNGIDRNSYVTLIDGSGKLNEQNLEIKEKKSLSVNDVLKTTSNDSLAIIEWGDGSITRLGGNTQIKIQDVYVSKNKDKINIAFNLIDGKTWSNVISFIGENSYFNQSFQDYEAAVRGTIFNVDLEKNYLYVVESNVDLKNSKNGKEVFVGETQSIDLKTFNLIKFEEFIKFFKDNSFDKLNRALDSEFFAKLLENLNSNLNSYINISSLNVNGLNDNEKIDLYNKILPYYQDLNFINPENANLYDLKISLKEKLLNIAPENEKKYLLNSFIFDFQDSIKSKSKDSFDKITNILFENKQNIVLDENLKNQINEYFKKIDTSLIKDSLQNNLNILKNSFLPK